MKISSFEKLPKKDLIVFDLDGTLIPTKSPMDKEMSGLISQLLSLKKVAIIGGGKYEVFKALFLRQLDCPKRLLKNLFLFPTTSTSFYRYEHGWKKIYALHLTSDEKNKIHKAFAEVLKQIGYVHPQRTYGKVIEDRGTQVTFSALGQDVVAVLGKKGVKLKEQWLQDNLEIKMQITKFMSKKLPNLEVRAAGFTSIDITRKGIDKSYGMRQIQKHLRIPIGRMLFVGDAIFPGGNDYAAVKTGVDYVPVKGPEQTKKLIRQILKQK